MSAIGRLAEMDREELRFRFTCEARKFAGRLRYAIHPPQWDRAAIVSILDTHAGPLVVRAADAARRHDYLAAHRALAQHFSLRASCWPVQARTRGALAPSLRDAFPEAVRATRARADDVLDGRHDLLGYRGVVVGNPPKWHADAVHHRTAPVGHWASVPYLAPASGDHKIIWETNRHQYFLTLGCAYWLTGDRRYRSTFIAHLEDWLSGNPPLRGVNWSSMLELAFRTMSWTWAVEFFAGAADSDEVPWLVDLLVSLDRQLTHVAHNLSSYFSPNTHLSGEALALYAVSTAFPELRRSPRRVASGRAVLLEEARHQIRGDGGHAELSAHYHRYSTDFYLLALMVARASSDAAAEPFERAARQQSVYLRTIADDRGRLPLIGDDDGGQMFRFGSVDPADASVTLEVAATLLADHTLAVTPATAAACWILGRPPTLMDADATARWPSRLLPDSGYMVARDGNGGHLVFDAGPHGFLNGGHAHADALGIVLTVAGDPLLIDPGTATYTMDAQARDRFRSSRMHNTVTLDGQDPAIPDGPFHWHTQADARFLVARFGDEVDFAVGTHDGYGVRRHYRAVLALHHFGYLIVDRVVTFQPTEAQAWWHLHPDWRARVSDRLVTLDHVSGRRLGLATTAHDISIALDPHLSEYAPAYGRIESATTLASRHAAEAPFTIGTFIPATAAETLAVAIDEVIGDAEGSPRWVSATFTIRSGSDERRVTVAFPAGVEAHPQDDWPQPCITRARVSRT